MAETTSNAATVTSTDEQNALREVDAETIAASASKPTDNNEASGEASLLDAPVNSPLPPASAPENPSSSTKDNDIAMGDDLATPTNGVTSAPKKKEKRKSIVPEHKIKKLNRKKSMPNVHLNAEPGQYWYVQMKGYQAWPAIICDEEMLPESLLSKRPVSAQQPDGSYRSDYMEGGKKARERRYPVMFLGTNEFAWHVNTDISPLDMNELKEIVKSGDHGKKPKSLGQAYEIAAEEHDLDYFKEMLVDHEKRMIKERQEFEEKQAKREENEAKKAKREEDEAKKAKRQSIATATAVVDAGEDVEMEDAPIEGEPKKSKKTKKRKLAAKDGEAEAGETPKSTLKKIKITTKEPVKEATPKTAKKTPKPKKAASPAIAPEAVASAEEQMTAEQKAEKKQKTILYLRHKLQKGFLSRDQAPKEEEMPHMADHLTQLEGFPELEGTIIRNTKINKVLKGILRLPSIPLEEQHQFKSRSEALLQLWNKSLNSEEDATPAAVADPVTTNGVAHDDKPAPEPATAVDPKGEESDVKANGDSPMHDVPTSAEPESAIAQTVEGTSV